MKRRSEQFKNILKEQEDKELIKISKKIQQIYSFTEMEMIYLQYFCSQSKLDDLDPSLNTLIYLWGKQKKTGKSTVSAYICSFLNGETKRNEEPHKSELKNEMQLERFAMPKAMTSRCTLMDEGGFFDMKKTYDIFKAKITSNSCEIEYKYKNSKRTKKCWRNYIMTSNIDPIYFIQDEEERRVLPIHFNRPENVSFSELEMIWYKFVLECNLDVDRLTKIYNEIILPQSVNYNQFNTNLI
jgi:hypothetical protein